MDGEHVSEFESHRPRLFAVAYRLLGSATEAEDAVQDTYLRWSDTDRNLITTPAAWLTKVLTNLCLNRLTAARARREAYVGPWLPEPVLTPDSSLGPLETVEQRESVSMALLVLLERLTPAERAVFVLREAFAYRHREIAEVLDLSEANCQQLNRRARQKLHDEQGHRPVSETPHEQRNRIAELFFAAAHSGDLTGLERLLADDVTAWADGGGKIGAARRPIFGSTRVARYLHGLFRQIDAIVEERFGPGLEICAAEVNGEPALLVTVDSGPLAVAVLELHDDRIAAIRTIVNPDKLAFIGAQLSRSHAGVLLWPTTPR
ncbi:RNA polymerase sigma-70 factor [Nocardiopsis gilva YIM 90087]|uniref:RNA polymerase sigma-70 factor n=1 Tax=Nocardiopsis gilva YIM 90087 TaxID=1235441 RepID=A0A223S1U5_9ACTN|nr:RNA polymerase sigma-70 factor [Nocardiopsis gilva YIM 90087]